MASLRDIATLCIDGDWIESKDQSDYGIRLIQTGNVGVGEYIDKPDRAKYISEDTFTRLKCTEVQSGDILVSRLPDPVGRACIVPNGMGKAITAVDCTIIRTDESVCLARYLLHFTESKAYEKQVKKFLAGSTRTRISRKNLENVDVPIIPIEQQRQVVRSLDHVSKLISLRKKQLQKLDDLVKSRFVEMFGDVIHNSKNWEKRNFSEIAASRLGKMLDGKKQTGKHSFPYLANSNVQWFRFDLSKMSTMDFDEKDRIEFELKDGDLLVCEGGEIGRCAVWHNEMQPCYFQKAIHRVRCDEMVVLPDYLSWWFKYQCEHDGFASIEGAKATIAHLPGTKLKALKVVVPSIELQKQFTAFIKTISNNRLTIHQGLDKLEQMKQALMQKYFGGKE